MFTITTIFNKLKFLKDNLISVILLVLLTQKKIEVVNCFEEDNKENEILEENPSLEENSPLEETLTGEETPMGENQSKIIDDLGNFYWRSVDILEETLFRLTQGPCYGIDKPIENPFNSIAQNPDKIYLLLFCGVIFLFTLFQCFNLILAQLFLIKNFSKIESNLEAHPFLREKIIKILRLFEQGFFMYLMGSMVLVYTALIGYIICLFSIN